MSTAYSSDYLPERKIAHLELVRLRDEFALCNPEDIEALKEIASFSK